VVVTPESANPFLGRLQNCFVRNRSTTGFTLRALDVDAPTYFEAQWLAVL
jgi:hypothetical protein